ncbi:IS3 family transposase [Neisseria sp. P0020.S005]|uniref:IS3 family transposase n=1 Tax=Neisseria sp. P0020.S005 TaxID=3436810 RepID=UPI003F7DCDA0
MGFFAVMKTECFAVQGELMMDELMKQIEDYMDSYNQERCSSKLKSRGLSHIEPGLYRVSDE